MYPCAGTNGDSGGGKTAATAAADKDAEVRAQKPSAVLREAASMLPAGLATQEDAPLRRHTTNYDGSKISDNGYNVIAMAKTNENGGRHQELEGSSDHQHPH